MPKAVAILDAQGNPMRRHRVDAGVFAMRSRISARYDAAETTTDNRRHWVNADALAADAAMSATIRRVLVSRSRYEIANNSYAKGIVLTQANDIIGTGPRLQVQLPPSSGLSRTQRKMLGRLIGDLFFAWADEILLARKLRTMCKAKTSDGETFAARATNPALESPVQLDLRPFECDRVSSPHAAAVTADEVDGVILDAYDNPVSYRVAKTHPGGALPSWDPANYSIMPARDITHWFRQDRAEAHRGVPEITPALPLFALLRGFTLATLDAAKNAANFTGILHTTGSPDADDNEEVALKAMTSMEFERNMWMALPDGYDINQFESKHPNTTYAEFKKEILNEIARCLNIPFNIAAGNSSGYNYASGRLDHQTYFKDIDVTREDCERVVLGPLFHEWLREACDYVPELSPFKPLLMRYWRWHQWFWDGRTHVDPLKEANADHVKMADGSLSETEYHARRGVYIEDHYDMLEEERAMRRERGLPPGPAEQSQSNPAPAAVPETPEEMQQRLLDEGEDPDDVEELVEQTEDAS